MKDNLIDLAQERLVSAGNDLLREIDEFIVEALTRLFDMLADIVENWKGIELPVIVPEKLDDADLFLIEIRYVQLFRYFPCDVVIPLFLVYQKTLVIKDDDFSCSGDFSHVVPPVRACCAG